MWPWDCGSSGRSTAHQHHVKVLYISRKTNIWPPSRVPLLCLCKSMTQETWCRHHSSKLSNTSHVTAYCLRHLGVMLCSTSDAAAHWFSQQHHLASPPPRKKRYTLSYFTLHTCPLAYPNMRRRRCDVVNIGDCATIELIGEAVSTLGGAHSNRATLAEIRRNISPCFHSAKDVGFIVFSSDFEYCREMLIPRTEFWPLTSNLDCPVIQTNLVAYGCLNYQTVTVKLDNRFGGPCWTLARECEQNLQRASEKDC